MEMKSCDRKFDKHAGRISARTRWTVIWLAGIVVPVTGAHADSRVCAACHARIYQTWQKSGMARSFSKPNAIQPVNDFYHAASETHFRVFERAGKYFQRRWQRGFQGREANIEEKSIDYVMGSGNHVRTFLHASSTGALQQLPLAWYSEKGGYWGMNPGYDNPDQPNSRRKINYECMGCHNAYPKIPAGHEQPRAEPLYAAELPQGIDCQRCHGQGDRHVKDPKSGGIVNPARLTPARQAELCMQCHLETTSFSFPHSVEKFDPGPFAYQPGEDLTSYLAYFDHPPSTDRFQIVSSVYRLRQSQCFRKSGDKLQCTTCHDPHDPGARNYNQVCRECHAQLAVTHTGAADCVTCHMAKRRTDDVVHAVMTDHLIRRTSPVANLLADKPEPGGAAVIYKGEALPYYPAKPDDLTLALAQVRFDVNWARGIPMLTAAIRRLNPRQPEYLVELGDALFRNGRPLDSLAAYRQAVKLRPNSLAALIGLGQALDTTNNAAQAQQVFRDATRAAPDDPFAWQLLGQSLLRLSRFSEAEGALQKSAALDPDAPETYYAVGLLKAQNGESADAERAFREAIRLQPDHAQAHLNLAIVLSRQPRLDEAEYHFVRALHFRPDYKLAHGNYGLMLRQAGRIAEAEIQRRLAEP